MENKRTLTWRDESRTTESCRRPRIGLGETAMQPSRAQVDGQLNVATIAILEGAGQQFLYTWIW